MRWKVWLLDGWMQLNRIADWKPINTLAVLHRPETSPRLITFLKLVQKFLYSTQLQSKQPQSLEWFLRICWTLLISLHPNNEVPPWGTVCKTKLHFRFYTPFHNICRAAADSRHIHPSTPLLLLIYLNWWTAQYTNCLQSGRLTWKCRNEWFLKYLNSSN